MTGRLASAQAKCQTGCQRQRSDKSHEEGIDQGLSNPNLVHRDHNAERPDGYTRDGLEQIRILSNLETDKDKLLQIVLVGQLNLKDLLRTSELRQLDQRVSIRYELKPLTREETAAYVAHRLTIAGGGAVVTFTSRALDLIHRHSGGIPRLINLICDRSLLGAYSARSSRIGPAIVAAAAKNLDLQAPRSAFGAWLRRRAAVLAGAALALALAATTAAYGFAVLRAEGGRLPEPPPSVRPLTPPVMDGPTGATLLGSKAP